MSQKYLNYLLVFVVPLMGLSGLALATPSDSASGASIFKTKCASCHGTNGAGTATGHSLNVVDLRSAVVQGHSDAQLEQVVKNGKDNMPPFSGTLTDQQISDVVFHVRTFKNKGGASNH
jgi:mono/diheme cytochrome c family protein